MQQLEQFRLIWEALHTLHAIMATKRLVQESIRTSVVSFTIWLEDNGVVSLTAAQVCNKFTRITTIILHY